MSDIARMMHVKLEGYYIRYCTNDACEIGGILYPVLHE